MRKYLRFLTPIIIRVLLSLERGLKTTTAFTSSNELKKKSVPRSDKLTMMHDVFPSFDNMISSNYQTVPNVFFFDEIDSTMNKAYNILPENKDKSVFSVVAKKQTSGRATKNRTWISQDRNLYMTVVVDKAALGSFPLILLPLKVGVLIGPLIQLRVYSGTPVHLKWPNDVLIGDQKICGTLIEVKDDRILIGIGCNVMIAPKIDSIGVDAGRTATCLSDHALKQQISQLSPNDVTSSANVSNTNETNKQVIRKGGNNNNTNNNEEKENIKVDDKEQQQQQQKLLYEVCDKLCDDLAIEINSTFESWINSLRSNTGSSSGDRYNHFTGSNRDRNSGGSSSRDWGCGSTSSTGYSGSSGTSVSEETIREFEKWMDKSPQILRREYNNTISSSSSSSSSSYSFYGDNKYSDLNDNNNDYDNSQNDNDNEYKSNDRHLAGSNTYANSNSDNSNNNSKQQQSQSLKGERVLPLKINDDGTLQVKVLSTGVTRTLVADYLW